MRLPKICGLIDRRLLVNFRVEPSVVANLLPPPFRPQTVKGFCVSGICLIRLKQIRPKHMPAFFGLRSENAAHRIAVEWDEDGRTQTGVYIPRRHTSLTLNALAGGRVFPGTHHLAWFEVCESEEQFQVSMESKDGSTSLSVDARLAQGFPADSIFASLDEVSDFFEAGSVGYSPHAMNGHFEGLELRCKSWQVQPLSVSHVESSYFNDENIFPTGSVEFDNALLMHGIEHEWHTREPICCAIVSSM